MFCLYVCKYNLFMLDAHRGQKRKPDHLEWELEMSEDAVWVLGTEPGSSTRAVSAFNHGAIAPGPCFFVSGFHT